MLIAPSDFLGRGEGKVGEKKWGGGRGVGRESLDGEWEVGCSIVSTSNSILADRDTAGVSVPDLEGRPCPSSSPF